MLTDKALQNLKPKGREYLVADRDGLYIRVNAKGTLSWVFRFRWKGRSQKTTLGHYKKHNPLAGMTLKQAREKAVSMAGMIENGINPIQHMREQENQASKQKTVNEVAKEFIDKVVTPNQLRAQQTIDWLEKEALPVLGNNRIEDVTRKQCIALLDTIVQRGAKASALKVKQLLTQLFNFALQRDYIASNPIQGLRKDALGIKEVPRSRVLNPAEITTLLHSLDSWRAHNSFKLAIRFILASGQRVSTVFGTHWDHIDLDQRIWHIPASSEEHFTKSPKPRDLPISDYMAEVIQQQGQYSGKSVFVWAAPSKPETCISKATLCTTITRNKRGGLEHWTIHDLRRTLITQMAELSIPLHVVEKVAGHELGGVLAVYNRYSYFDEQREALEKWGQRLNVLENSTGNVRLLKTG